MGPSNPHGGRERAALLRRSKMLEGIELTVRPELEITFGDLQGPTDEWQ
jgi:hypothetical protein